LAAILVGWIGWRSLHKKDVSMRGNNFIKRVR